MQDLTKIVIAAKVQSAEGTPSSGAGATGLEVTPSQGLNKTVARIESQLIKRNRMRNRPRHGSISVAAAYETELMVGAIEPFIAAILGNTRDAALAFTNTDWGALVITGTGTTLTFASGTILTDLVRVGMMGRLTNMSVAGNNDVWFPILGATEGVMTVPSGFLVDNASDAAWNIAIASHIYTPTIYEDTFWTVEEYGSTADQSKLGTDSIWNELSVQQAPNQMARVSLGVGGKDMDILTTGLSPNFTDPVFGGGDPVLLLDGSVIVNGVARVDLTSLTFGLAAPITHTPMISTRISPVSLGMFAFTGEVAGTVDNYDDFDDFNDETDVSLLLRFAERGGLTSEFISFYMGHLSFGGFTSGAGGEGPMIKSMQLFGGDDKAGGSHAQTTMLVSTSAA